jgi:hypothetical protein
MGVFSPGSPLREAYRRWVPSAIRRRVHARYESLLRAPDMIEPRITGCLGLAIEDWWNDPAARRMAERLRQLRGRYAGRRCVIQGNGPSLNEMDLEVFADEFVWGSNRAYLLYDRISWRHAFYVGVDTRVIPDIADELMVWIARLPRTQFFFPYRFRSGGVLRGAPNIVWYPEVVPRDNPVGGRPFSRSCSRWVSSVNTVTLAALQLAAHMGFSPIYLIGCDTSYTVPDSVQIEDDDPKKLVSTDDDQNHFDASYFGAGRRWHDPQVHRMIENYEVAKRVCDRMGVEVYNATVGGQLEVFPRVDYQKVFG